MRNVPSGPAIAPATSTASGLERTATDARAIGVLLEASWTMPRTSPFPLDGGAAVGRVGACAGSADAPRLSRQRRASGVRRTGGTLRKERRAVVPGGADRPTAIPALRQTTFPVSLSS